MEWRWPVLDSGRGVRKPAEMVRKDPAALYLVIRAYIHKAWPSLGEIDLRPCVVIRLQRQRLINTSGAHAHLESRIQIRMDSLCPPSGGKEGNEGKGQGISTDLLLILSAL